MERHDERRAPRWLLLLAGALVWTSADGNRQARPRPEPMPRPVVQRVAPPPQPEPPIVELYYPADPPPEEPAPAQSGR